MLDNVITWILTIAVALLAAWSGLLKRKVSRAEKRAMNAEAKAGQASIQESVTKVASDIKDEISGNKQQIDKNQKAEEALIVEAKSDEETIRMANDIVSRFNAR